MEPERPIDAIQKMDPLVCPHCGSGQDGTILGLFWEEYEKAWRCIVCGHRTFERRKKSPAELVEDKIWDRILDILDSEEESREHRPGEEDGEREFREAI